MNMYEKREARKNKQVEEKTTTTNINWDIGTYRQLTSNPYKIRAFAK